MLGQSRQLRATKPAKRQSLRRTLQLEVFERRDMFAVEFMNAIDSLDVSADNNITAIDALYIINDINVSGPRQLPATRPSDAKYIDTSGDGFVTAIDALLVINQLNRGTMTGLSRVLRDASGFAMEETIRIGNGSAAGLRTFSLSLEAAFGSAHQSVATADVFAVYLVTSDRTHATLLDSGIDGSPIFTLSSLGATITPGVTRFEGNTLSIDLANVAQEAPIVKLQLLNHDTAFASKVTAAPISNNVDPDGQIADRFERSRQVAGFGGTTNVAAMTLRNDVDAELSEIQFDKVNAVYATDLSIINRGAPIGRDTVVTFPGLPAGVVISNASGVTPAGIPYVNMQDAISNGGIGTNDRSQIVRLSIRNPGDQPFALVSQVLTGELNRQPVLPSISPITLMPGLHFVLALNANDPDGDTIRYSITNAERMPTTSIMGNEIIFSPTASQIGTYQFDVVASDGVLSDQKSVTLSVIPDPVTTTRLSGKVLAVDASPIVGMRVEVGAVQGITQADGSFLLDFGNTPAGDTLRIRADLFNGGTMPFIAEKIPLLLERNLATGINNQILRPIYLPTLNSGTRINPTVNQTVTEQLKPGEAPAAVHVAAGTLISQTGAPFTGNLSITEVPPSRTPAILPNNIIADTVVTIQPGEMTFATPTPLTLPNRGDFPPGTMFDLWSINPVTGSFEVVGKGKVSADRSRIDTVEGGIRFSSWHTFVPETISPQDETTTPANCGAPTPKICATSNVVVYSGTYIEDHTTPSYTSLGIDRSVTLVYSSKRSSPENVIRFNTNLPTWFDKSGNSDDHIGINIVVRHGETRYGIPGNGTTASNTIVINTGNVEGTDRVGTGVQLDMSDMPDGVFQYTADIGAYRSNGSQSTASRVPLTGQLVKVSGKGSSVGTGWGIAGLQYLIIAPDESTVLLVDGNATELLFTRNPNGTYASPTGDFSVLSKPTSGNFQRRLKDGTVYAFNATNKLETVTDRNQNRTTYEYDSLNRLSRIVDPVGLATIFSYNALGLSAIILPDGRQTSFTLNAAGDLVKITDPDNSTRNFGYDGSHRIVSEITPLGAKETTEYDAFGRVRKVIRADGSTMEFSPAELKGVPYLARSAVLLNLPSLTNTGFTKVVMPSGNVLVNKVDRGGLVTSTSDKFGLRQSTIYNDLALPAKVTDTKREATDIEYDSFGNVVRTSEILSNVDNVFTSSAGSGDNYFPYDSRIVYSNISITDLLVGDVTGDLKPDTVIVGSRRINNETSVGVIQTLTGTGSDLFGPTIESPTLGNSVRSALLLDLNNDSVLDVVAGTYEGSATQLRILKGNGSGAFQLLNTIDFGQGLGVPYVVRTGDINADGLPDILVFAIGWPKMAVVLNQGAFGFTRLVDIDLGVTVDEIILADFGSDDFDDLVLISSTVNSLMLFKGDGNGGFSLSQRVDQPDSVRSIMLLDVNSDNRSDIVLSSSRLVTTFLALGEDELAVDGTITLPLSGGNLTAIDLGTDGSLDVVVQMSDTSNRETHLAVLRNIDNRLSYSGEIQSGISTRHQAAIDMDGDGRQDLVGVVASSSGIQLLMQNAEGRFPTQPTLEFQNSILDRRIADINEDGYADILFTNSDGGGITIALGDGLGGFSAPVRDLSMGTGRLEIADMGGDGHLDLIIAKHLSLQIYNGRGDGSFTPGISIETAMDVTFAGGGSITVGAIDDDEMIDIAIGGSRVGPTGGRQHAISTLRQNSSGGLTLDYVSADRLVGKVKLVDMNGDGRSDLVSTEFEPGNFGGPVLGYLKVSLGNGAGQFEAAFEKKVLPSGPQDFDVDDLDQDGRPDIVLTSKDQGMLDILFQQPGVTFSESSLTFTSWAPVSPLIRDVNSDGIADVVVSDTYWQSVTVFLGKGNRQFDERISLAASVTIGDIAFADLDLDGRCEFLATVSSSIVLIGIETFITTSIASRSFVYEGSFSRLYQTTDERGVVTRFNLDPTNGNVTAITRPLGYRETMTYTASGLLDLHTDALGHVTDFDYDAFGRLVKVTSAKGTVDEITQTFGYDAIGNVSQATDANGHTTRFEYDSKRRLTKETDSLGGVTTYTRDAAGNVLTVTDALNRVTRFTYDGMSRLTSTTDPLGQKTTYSFDAAGNLVAVVDPLGKVTRNIYDVARRLVRSIDASGGTTKFTYDGNDNLLTVTDPVGNLTRYFYDERNRLVREQDPLLQSTFYLYDGADNLIAKRDRNERQTSFIYDALNRQIEEKWLGVNTGELANTITSTFDLNSNLLTVADDASKLTFTYDSLDRVKTASNLGTPGQPSVLLTYGYAGSNLVTTTDTINGVSGATVAYQFDELNRPKSILQTGTEIGTKRVDYTYNAISQYTGITRSNNANGSAPVVTTSFAYDDAYRLTMMDHRNATSTSLASFGFAYDAASRITQIVENGKAIDYSYDDRDQLTAANYADSTRTDETFVFDSNGNRTQSNEHGSAYRTGPANRLLTDGTFNYEYDKEGNLSKRTEITTGSTREFQWEHRNRLLAVTDKNTAGISQQVVKFTYDALDRRISKSGDTTPNDAVDAAIEQYVYDGNDIILDFLDADGSGPATAIQTARYLRGPGIDNLLAIEANSQTLWVLQDQLGSTRALVDQSGNLIQTIQYDAFGKALLDGQALTRYLFTGREVDSQTVLYYYRARYYDPAIGQFIAEDPLGLVAGDTNLRRYVFNFPLNWRDPLGKQVIFDRSDQTITFPDGRSFPASNNPIRPKADPFTPNGFGPAPNGTFPLGKPISTGQDSNGSFGPKFSPISLPKNEKGTQRSGVGLHSGRANRKGYLSKTLGCIRTTDSAMEYLDKQPQDSIIIQD